MLHFSDGARRDEGGESGAPRFHHRPVGQAPSAPVPTKPRVAIGATTMHAQADHVCDGSLRYADAPTMHVPLHGSPREEANDVNNETMRVGAVSPRSAAKLIL